MPYLCIFVEEVVMLLGKLLTTGCKHLSNINYGQVKVAAKNIHTKRFASELWVKKVGTFGAVLYQNQLPMHFAELYIGSSIRYEKIMFGNYFFTFLYSQTNFDILQLYF